jgi:hypothetical protein
VQTSGLRLTVDPAVAVMAHRHQPALVAQVPQTLAAAVPLAHVTTARVVLVVQEF